MGRSSSCDRESYRAKVIHAGSCCRQPPIHIPSAPKNSMGCSRRVPQATCHATGRAKWSFGDQACRFKDLAAQLRPSRGGGSRWTGAGRPLPEEGGERSPGFSDDAHVIGPTFHVCGGQVMVRWMRLTLVIAGAVLFAFGAVPFALAVNTTAGAFRLFKLLGLRLHCGFCERSM